MGKEILTFSFIDLERMLLSRSSRVITNRSCLLKEWIACPAYYVAAARQCGTCNAAMSDHQEVAEWLKRSGWIVSMAAHSPEENVNILTASFEKNGNGLNVSHDRGQVRYEWTAVS